MFEVSDTAISGIWDRNASVVVDAFTVYLATQLSKTLFICDSNRPPNYLKAIRSTAIEAPTAGMLGRILPFVGGAGFSWALPASRWNPGDVPWLFP